MHPGIRREGQMHPHTQECRCFQQAQTGMEQKEKHLKKKKKQNRLNTDKMKWTYTPMLIYSNVNRQGGLNNKLRARSHHVQ